MPKSELNKGFGGVCAEVRWEIEKNVQAHTYFTKEMVGLIKKRIHFCGINVIFWGKILIFNCVKRLMYEDY